MKNRKTLIRRNPKLVRCNDLRQGFLTGSKFTPLELNILSKEVNFLKYKLKQTSVFSIKKVKVLRWG